MSVVDTLFLGERCPLWSYWSSRSRVHAAERVLFELSLDVDPMQRVETLPLATRQMIEIARALARDARILVMDEPTSSLDVTIQQQVLQLLAELQRRHSLSYVLVTHDIDVVRAMAHRVMVMREGRVVEAGPIDEVMSRPQSDYTRELMSA